MAKYPPANICIYCGRSASDLREDLSEEHIIPFSLGGTSVLPAASCKKDRDLTSAIERYVAQHFYGSTRAHLGIRSRHKKNRQAKLDEGVLLDGADAAGNTRQIRVPFEEAPPIPVVPRLPPPNALLGLLPSEKSSISMSVSPQAGRWLARIRKQYGLSTIHQRSETMDPYVFMRFLAKVAHAFAAADLGRQNYESWLVPTILGEYKTPNYLIGGFSPELEQHTEPLRRRFQADGTRQLVVAEISIRSLHFLPRYQVVCGRLLT